MSRKRRTKREKLIAELRRKAYIPKESISSKSKLEAVPLPKIQMNTVTNTPKNYSYVLHDMKKTTIIVSAIFFLNFVIFLLLENNIVKLGFLG